MAKSLLQLPIFACASPVHKRNPSQRRSVPGWLINRRRVIKSVAILQMLCAQSVFHRILPCPLLHSTDLSPKLSSTFLASFVFQDGLHVEIICCPTTCCHSLLYSATPTPKHRPASKGMRYSRAAPTGGAFLRPGLHNQDTSRYSLPTSLSSRSRSLFSARYSHQSAYYIHSRSREHQSYPYQR